MIRPVIMCKAPVAGCVKTRLQPEYSAEQAAEIHALMATSVISRLTRLFPNAWIAADKPAHRFFQAFDLPVVAQGEGDLGERLAHMLHIALDYGASGVLFSGTDNPHISDARLLAAIRMLANADIVIGPVEDGGYDLIAVRGLHEGIFANIPWSTERVLEETLEGVRRLGLKHRLLSMSFDVDTPADLLRCCRSSSEFKSPAALLQYPLG